PEVVRSVVVMTSSFDFYRTAHGSEGYPRFRMAEGRAYGETMMRSSTFVTPGADQATRSASSRSIHERTVPVRITSLPLVSTTMRLASTSALRLNASWIFLLISEGSARGRSRIMLLTPLTPLI